LLRCAGPVAESRLKRREDGRYAYETTKGVTSVMSAEQLVRRLLWLIPPKGLHLTNFHGAFAQQLGTDAEADVSAGAARRRRSSVGRAWVVAIPPGVNPRLTACYPFTVRVRAFEIPHRQWHNEVNPTFGTKLGDFFRDFVAGEAHSLGVAVGDLRKWTPPAAPKRATVEPAELLAALAAWKPEAEEDEDNDEESGPPERPTEFELASAVGVTNALVAKAVKKLIADGLVEKLSGRPARYVATGNGE
jgi:hypothetical protein